MQTLAHSFIESSNYFMIGLLIHTDAEISILPFQGFSENILFFLSEYMRKIFYKLYCARVLGQENLGSSTVYETAILMWASLQSYEVMV